MSLSEHVRTLGRGPGRARSLTQDEAQDAMTQMLNGAAPEAIGALLMLLRMKGETPDEIAGFVTAAQTGVTKLPAVDLDWPSYAAGRSRGLPWFLLAARLVAQDGHHVLLHGANGATTLVREGIDALGIPRLTEPSTAQHALAQHKIAYLPLERMSPGLYHLLSLRSVLGLRSCVNTVSRMLNPARALASVQGVFHPSYRQLQSTAAHQMGWRNLSIIKGGGGEFECHPGKDVAVHGLRDGQLWETNWQSHDLMHRRLDDGARDVRRLEDLWQGRCQDPFAEAIVLRTAALAFDTLGIADPMARAERAWTARLAHVAA